MSIVEDKPNAFTLKMPNGETVSLPKIPQAFEDEGFYKGPKPVATLRWENLGPSAAHRKRLKRQEKRKQQNNKHASKTRS